MQFLDDKLTQSVHVNCKKRCTCKYSGSLPRSSGNAAANRSSAPALRVIAIRQNGQSNIKAEKVESGLSATDAVDCIERQLTMKVARVASASVDWPSFFNFVLLTVEEIAV